jgi:hypothetical protein
MAVSSGAAAQLLYEVVWCCPATRSLIHHHPRPARFKEIKHARAFIKAFKSPPAETFVVIRRSPVDEAISESENAVLMAEQTEKAETYKWEVVGRTRDDYTKTHMICYGAPLGFSDRVKAQACADFVNRFLYSVREDLLIEVVPWKANRQWLEGLATELNTVV